MGDTALCLPLPPACPLASHTHDGIGAVLDGGRHAPRSVPVVPLSPRAHQLSSVVQVLLPALLRPLLAVRKLLAQPPGRARPDLELSMLIGSPLLTGLQFHHPKVGLRPHAAEIVVELF